MLGIRGKRQRTNPPARADALADIVLRDQDDREVRLGDLWRDRPAALVWMRHYG
jgi:hypothetical protein